MKPFKMFPLIVLMLTALCSACSSTKYIDLDQNFVLDKIDKDVVKDSDERITVYTYSFQTVAVDGMDGDESEYTLKVYTTVPLDVPIDQTFVGRELFLSLAEQETDQGKKVPVSYSVDNANYLNLYFEGPASANDLFGAVQAITRLPAQPVVLFSYVRHKQPIIQHDGSDEDLDTQLRRDVESGNKH